jgi:hypothetical protein
VKHLLRAAPRALDGLLDVAPLERVGRALEVPIVGLSADRSYG